MRFHVLALLCVTILPQASLAANDAISSATPKKVVLMAGKPSHAAREHEFNAGVQLLAKCLENVRSVDVEFLLNGWPEDETPLEQADAIIFFMDGGKKHEAVQEDGRRLKRIAQWVEGGTGIGCMHYGVEVLPNQAGAEFKSWIGGHYEHMFSCNPMWEPKFETFPSHPIANGVQPFSIKDEWYFNMRFIGDVPGDQAVEVGETELTPILVAVPSDSVRAGPYVYPKGPYGHIQANANRAEAMMWAVEKANGHRGFGFTGGHYHDNWANDNFRKVVLNAILWVAAVEVPKEGVASKLAPGDIDRNLDPKAR